MAGRNCGILRDLAQLLPFFRREHAVDGRIDVAGLAPRVLLQKQRIGDGIVLAQLVGSGGQRGGLPGELVLGQREIVMHEPHLALPRVLFLYPLHRLLVKRLAGRALEIAEEIDPDGGGDGTYRATGCRLRGRTSRRCHDEGDRGEDD